MSITLAETPPEEKTEEKAAQVTERSYKASYFLPGRLEEKVVQFLVSTRCTTNLLSYRIINTLLGKVKILLEESTSQGLLADDTQLPFYSIIKRPVRIRDVKA